MHAPPNRLHRLAGAGSPEALLLPGDQQANFSGNWTFNPLPHLPVKRALFGPFAKRTRQPTGPRFQAVTSTSGLARSNTSLAACRPIGDERYRTGRSTRSSDDEGERRTCRSNQQHYPQKMIALPRGPNGLWGCKRLRTVNIPRSERSKDAAVGCHSADDGFRDLDALGQPGPRQLPQWNQAEATKK